MSKREDAGYIKIISKVLPIVLDWAFVPLFVLDKDTHIAKQAEVERARIEVTDKAFSELMDDACLYKPSQDFLFMDKTIVLNEHITLKYNYFYVSFREENGMPKFVNILYPTQRDKLMWFGIMREENGQYSSRLMQAQGTRNEKWNASEVENGKFDYKGDKEERIQRFMTAILVKMATTLRALGHSDLYPIERKGIQHRKIHAKKPWTRSDLPTIIFLNKLPTEYIEPQGGHHNSPHPHTRRGAWRRLDNERFKNHPKYRDKIWIKPTWVGEKETTIQNITYKVL